METTEKTQIEMPADLAKRYNEAKTDQERNAVLFDFAKLRGADDLRNREAAIMSKEQFETLVKKMGELSASNAKAAIEAVSSDVVRKYDLSEHDAREVAEKSLRSVQEEQANRREDFQIAAEVFRGMYLARQGKPDAYRAAIEKEGEYFKRVYGRTTRAMSLGTDSTGGYLAPQKFSDMLYENISRQSHVRRYATIIPMQANEVINIPTMTSSLSAAVVSEGSTASGVQPTFSQKQLTTKKIVTKTRPISVEMIEKANPAIVQLLLQFAMIEIMKAEDSLVFGTSGNGIRASSTNNVVLGSAAGGYDSFDFDDFISMESELTAEYLGGDDIQGSGVIADGPRYWLPHALVQAMKKKKSGVGEYLDEARELRNQKQIFGYEAKRVLSLPDGISPALGLNDKVAIFGNLSHVWCGTEPGFRIAIADQGGTDNGGSEVNLFDTAQVAIRVLEFFDSVVVDDEAFSIAKLAA